MDAAQGGGGDSPRRRQIALLEEQKRAAAAREDFAEALRLKGQQEELRRAPAQPRRSGPSWQVLLLGAALLFGAVAQFLTLLSAPRRPRPAGAQGGEPPPCGPQGRPARPSAACAALRRVAAAWLLDDVGGIRRLAAAAHSGLPTARQRAEAARDAEDLIAVSLAERRGAAPRTNPERWTLAWMNTTGGP
eukprot:TRINITY_DN13238_c0_g1_i1.p2 TRINITY_DN13238_c0_g1~~TRINITY_DN13238_c0_g1_i1.p2  ORF type:complete len:218 (+),score=83.14 TRINITY_DN13238_c0_g1_i1:86-655(+)